MRIMPSSHALAFFLCDCTLVDAYTRIIEKDSCSLWLEQDPDNWRWILADESGAEISSCPWVAVDSSTAPKFEEWIFHALGEREANREGRRIAQAIYEPQGVSRKRKTL